MDKYKNVELKIKKFNTLYKRSANCSILQWTIFCDDIGYWTEFGQVGGVITKSNKTFVFPKNVGKANETTQEEQAIKEAESLYELKLKSENFFESAEDIDNIGFQPPMLAKKFEGFSQDKEYFVQPKLDGVRMNISFNFKKNNIEALSRRNNEFYTVNHIINSLHDWLNEHPTIHLDGELYNHELHDDFNKIVSLVRKKNISNEDEKEIIRYVKYYIYDCWDDSDTNLVFSERQEILAELKSLNLPYIEIVPTNKINPNMEELNSFFENYINNGYEGAIVREDEPYEHKRSKHLLKYKSFEDSEFKVIDICEGKGSRANVAGYVILDLGDGKTCKSNIKGGIDFCRELLENKEKYIGKMATINYFEKTNDGSLRFPYLKCFRDYE